MAGNNKYRDELVQQIKDAGNELVNRAETLVDPDLSLISDFSITIDFPQDCFPSILVSTTVLCKTTHERYFRKDP